MPTSFKPSAAPPAERSSNSSRLILLPGPWLLFGLALAVAAIVCLSFPRVDGKAQLDRQIEDGWMDGRETVDALAFFEKGGVYENRDAPGAENIDQTYVVPLIKQLRDKHRLDVLVIEHDKLPNTAMAVIAEAPADRASRNAVRQTILETTDSFPGLVTQNWSHHWVSLDFFDEEESIAFHRAGAFDKLKESQQRME